VELPYRRRRPPRGTMYITTRRATTTTAAMATMATLDAATIMAGIIRACPCRPEAPPFAAFRLHARPRSAPRTHARAVPPRAPAQQTGRPPFAPALPPCARAHGPFVVGVAVGVGGAPALAHVVADFPQLAEHTHCFAPPEERQRRIPHRAIRGEAKSRSRACRDAEVDSPGRSRLSASRGNRADRRISRHTARRKFLPSREKWSSLVSCAPALAAQPRPQARGLEQEM
jgi:hypothetical protein